MAITAHISQGVEDVFVSKNILACPSDVNSRRTEYNLFVSDR